MSSEGLRLPSESAMAHTDRDQNRRDEPRTDERERRERAAVPPIEREHETQEGVFKEDERREREGGGEGR
jgi:hypothetical protein